MPRLSVAIVGAGLSSLALALALRKFGPDVRFELYEGATQLSEIGAGISVQARAWVIMKALGLDTMLLNIAGGEERRTTRTYYRKADQSEGIDLQLLESTETITTFHRAELQKVLLDDLQTSHTIRLGKRLASYTHTQDGQAVELHFQDGTTATCDVLVGADGIRSAVREAMFTQLASAAQESGKAEEAADLRACIPELFSGFVIYRTLIHKASLPQEDGKHPAFNKAGISAYMGKNKHFIAYPISQGRIINIAGVMGNQGQADVVYDGPRSTTATKSELIERYAGWESEVQHILEHANGPISKWVISVASKLPTYVHERVAILGDAAHAMTPFQGAGAGQCFEDAYLLAQLLSSANVTKDNVPLALKVYDEIRRPFSQNVAALSLLSGRTSQLNTPQHADLTEEQSATGTALTIDQLRENLAEIQRLGEWQFGPTIVEETEAALRQLEERLLKA
ncbi:FAD/NAD(P)-binding domain-containing protein [Earliella scabrosa]|nr:FAD/NAD(P)-binding domain-containing protein [Earliella scabrosa]